MSYTHYIIVRSDLPFGITCAMVTHAAGESGYTSTVYGYFPVRKGTTAVVLQVPNEEALFETYKFLKSNDVKFHDIVESEGYYAQQLMAIGVCPVEGDDAAKVRKLLKPYKLLGA